MTTTIENMTLLASYLHHPIVGNPPLIYSVVRFVPFSATSLLPLVFYFFEGRPRAEVVAERGFRVLPWQRSLGWACWSPGE